MIKTDINGNIGIISIDRPPVNAINPELVSSLSESLDSFHSNDSIQGVILEGRSGIFSAGLDITHLFPKDREYIKTFWESFSSLLNKMFTYEKPLYSSIGGHCPAGGTVMVIMTDYRIMANGKYVIGLNEVDVGLTVPYGIGNVFQYVVGQRKAEDLLLKAKLISPEDALKNLSKIFFCSTGVIPIPLSFISINGSSLSQLHKISIFVAFADIESVSYTHLTLPTTPYV